MQLLLQLTRTAIPLFLLRNFFTIQLFVLSNFFTVLFDFAVFVFDFFAFFVLDVDADFFGFFDFVSYSWQTKN